VLSNKLSLLSCLSDIKKKNILLFLIPSIFSTNKKIKNKNLLKKKHNDVSYPNYLVFLLGLFISITDRASHNYSWTNCNSGNELQPILNNMFNS
jgi:hypothetical protein